MGDVIDRGFCVGKVSGVDYFLGFVRGLLAVLTQTRRFFRIVERVFIPYIIGVYVF